ncbi:HNH endonuclease [Serratia phage vB_SmaM-ChuuTotoro]|nr:HNH endonuclease [Serratia phage vB_SmaM-ChuuTotoro]
MVLWKDAFGYEDLFEVSSNGDIRNKKTGRALKQTVGSTGYLNVATKIGGRTGKNVCFRMRRVILQSFIGDQPGKEVNHKDGVKTNNILQNLEWVTSSENSRHAFEIGLAKAHSGTDHPSSKLTLEEVEIIKRLRSEGYTCRELGLMFGVHHMQISRASRGISYKIKQV